MIWQIVVQVVSCIIIVCINKLFKIVSVLKYEFYTFIYVMYNAREFLVNSLSEMISAGFNVTQIRREELRFSAV